MKSQKSALLLKAGGLGDINITLNKQAHGLPRMVDRYFKMDFASAGLHRLVVSSATTGFTIAISFAPGCKQVQESLGLVNGEDCLGESISREVDLPKVAIDLDLDSGSVAQE
ncbi:hypothetical protein FRC03_010390 [Tulasnella sp. 419]|nr:hypothetical protein FRC03_010390 [Tulasnella sp. 419]